VAKIKIGRPPFYFSEFSLFFPIFVVFYFYFYVSLFFSIKSILKILKLDIFKMSIFEKSSGTFVFSLFWEAENGQL
jgi:hypothetical protein